MNKIFKKLTGGVSHENCDYKKAKTSGKLFDWCQEKLTPLGLHIDNVTPYSFAVYRGGDVVGYYNTLSDIKEAIKKGYVTEPYNL